MRHIFALILLAVGTWNATGATAAPAIPYGEATKLVFISDTGLFTDDGLPLSVCSVWTRQHVVYVGYWGTQRYVLATDQCEAPRVINEYPTSVMLEDRVQGLIPANVSNEPEISIGFVAYCFMAWAVGSLVFLIWANGALSRRAKERRRRKMLGDVNPYVARMITVMTHAARADGKISDVEIDLMLSTLKNEANVSVDVQDLLRVINMTPKIKTDAEYKNLGRGLDADGRQRMFNAGVAMIAADGIIEKSERKWLSRLGIGLGYKKRELSKMFKGLENGNI